MSRSFKTLLFAVCLAVAAASFFPDAARAAAYTAPPSRQENSGRAGQPLAGPAAMPRANGENGPAAPIYLENLGGAGETEASGARLAEHAFYLLDPLGSLSIEQAGSPAAQSSYTRLLDGVPLTSSGVFWLRFSLASADPARLQPAAGPVLRLQPGTPPARMYVAQEFARNGDVRRWREIAPAAGNAFNLPDPRGLPLTVYMKFDGVPGLWFNPELTAAEAGAQGPADYLPLAVQVVLGLAILVLLLRGLAGREEWRLWGAAVLGCALVQALFCRQSPELGSVYLTALPPLLAPGLLVMLMPHLGRHLLQSRERKLMDFFLILLSLPGAAAALLPLVPGLGWSAKFLPLAPLLLLPLLLVAASATARRQPGGITYFLICFFPLLGALLALLGLCLAEMQFDFNNRLYQLGPNLTYYGYAAAALVMMFGGRARKENREDFFPLEISSVSAFNTGGEQDLKLYAADDLPETLSDVLPGAWSDFPEEPAAALSPEEPPSAEPTAAEQPADLLPTLESFPLDEDGEPVLRIVRLYTPEPEVKPEEPTPAEEPAPVEEPAAPEAPLPLEVEAVEPELQEGDTLEEMPEAPSAPLPAEAPLEEAPLLEEPAETEPDPALSPAPAVEDATREIAPFNLTDVVWYKDQEEPGLVIIKPGSLAEPPFPLAQPGKDEPAQVAVPASENEEPLELTELVLPLEAAAPEAVEIAEAAEPFPAEEAAAAELVEAAAAPSIGPAEAEEAEDSLSGLDEALNCLDRLARAEAMNKADLRVFNLSSLVRRIHAETVELAERRGIALSWFVSPSLDLLYKGDEKTLRLTLSHMLRGAVESARDGAIQLAVRPAPEGENLIRFSLTDSALTPDSPRPPARLLSRAWELACASQGSFSIEFVPERGTSINFSLRLKPLEDEDYIEAAQQGFQLARRPAQNRPQPRGLDEMTGLAEAPAGTKDLDGPLAAEVLDGVALSAQSARAGRPVRDSIVIVDPADSGRRLIARRLGSLPYDKVEAASLREAAQACSWGNVALLILDGELQPDEVRQALAAVDAEEAAGGRPPVPSLCLLTHMSQCERLLKAGCTACQVKSENREEFQALVQRLIQEELKRSGPDRASSPVGAGLADLGQSISMLDMIVSSLDSESAELEKSGHEDPARQAGPAQSAPAGPGLGVGFDTGALTRLAGASGEYMDSAMVPMIPGFLDVMRENLQALEDGVAGMKFAQVQEVTARMQSQSKTYGLSNLERMAACVERAAQAKDREAVSDLSEELALMCRRYLNSLRETHESASR